MILIDFTANPRAALAHGFLKGMAAPALLFADFAPPAVPKVEPLPRLAPPSGSDAERLAGDWAAIGGDLARVIERHASAQA